MKWRTTHATGWRTIGTENKELDDIEGEVVSDQADLEVARVRDLAITQPLTISCRTRTIVPGVELTLFACPFKTAWPTVNAEAHSASRTKALNS